MQKNLWEIQNKKQHRCHAEVIIQKWNKEQNKVKQLQLLVKSDLEYCDDTSGGTLIIITSNSISSQMRFKLKFLIRN